jgi:alpha-galactosidase
MIFNMQSWTPIESIVKIPKKCFAPITQIKSKNIKPKDFKLKEEICGWCSWYRFEKDISKENLINEATRQKKIHPEIEYILIDDGWCSWGDWQIENIKPTVL